MDVFDHVGLQFAGAQIVAQALAFEAGGIVAGCSMQPGLGIRAAIASSSDVSSDMTKFLRPRETTLMPFRRAVRGALDSNV